ncbi:hypothetical protein LNAOJCKE_0945 [Methylorubrum aminovorans]|uniref:Portal protein n=1 Tax=Methylorubrum aminovorans TaxID=269069 RepID=A0ABQ4UA76_9HYPH|nr:hypothetical protein [Methylorubrum aminovorans]GJE63747.1 hypothetical protein LNAOJCKE_0945 [Methylorubrum aminovorans]GMA73585.1 hypothetical protein GCM10025880_00020 [Methylorubrum aminovorans]GMA73674.1 hypothetical protein GCM10025880_00910 [Methylorubrum aminovorans]
MAVSPAPSSAPLTPPGGYGAVLPPTGVAVVEPEVVRGEDKGESLHTLKKWFDAYQETKRDEMLEQQQARRYYHGAQWTDEERRVLNDRNQPPVTNNRISLKIDGIVGVVERLRQDPKAQARHQAHAAGAEIGTAAVREVLDANAWDSLSSQIAQDLAIDGLGGLERDIETDIDGQPNIVLRRVAPETFFYDPRSVKADFSDARYQGVYKWMDLDAAIEMLPEKEADLKAAVDKSPAGSFGLQDWEKLWYDTRLKRVKVVEVWYKFRGGWRFALHTGDIVLAEGESPFRDRRGKARCRYNMASAGVDQDGDRYGFVRNMKSPQDEINHRRSKLLHILNTNQVIYEEGAVDDIEESRRQLARPDGAIKVNPGQPRFEIRDLQIQLQGQAQLLQEAKAEIDNFGPTPALLGSGPGSQSGRAQAMQQQAGIAQLGPYFGRYKAWKIDLYRDLWFDIQQFWTDERFIRVSGPNELEFLPINQMVMTPEGPRIANAIGELDLDMVMDEGPDTVTLNEDTMQVLDSMIQKGLIAGPGALPLVAEVANLTPSVRQKLAAMNQPPQPDPQALAMQQAAQQLQFADAQAKVRKTNAEADRAQADAMSKMATLNEADAVGEAKAITEMAHMQARTRQINQQTAQATMAPLGMPAMTAQASF